MDLPTNSLGFDLGNHGNRACIAVRAQIVALKQFGASNRQISEITTISERQIYRFWKKAIDRGYDPVNGSKALKDEYLSDEPRSGRPKKATLEATSEILTEVRKSRKTRSYTLIDLSRACSTGLSPTTIWRILKEARFSYVKPSRKPGLTKSMKEARLRFCLEYQYWTLDDWKKVLWSDETSVVHGAKRGGERVWRTAEEAYDKTCIRVRWKGFSEFMFWGCFSYDYKGPYHIYKSETAAQKKAAKKVMDDYNAYIEVEAQEA